MTDSVYVMKSGKILSQQGWPQPPKVPSSHTVTFTGAVEVVRTPPDDKIERIKSFKNLSKFNIFKPYEKTACFYVCVWISKSLSQRTVKIICQTSCCL